MIKRLISAILLTLILSWQAEAARTVICGFEMGSQCEGVSQAGIGCVAATAITMQGVTKRTGSYAMQWKSTTGNSGTMTFSSRAAGGAQRSLFRSIRFYFQVAVLPSVAGQIYITLNASNAIQDYLKLGTDGKLTVGHGSTDDATSTNALSVDGTWHYIEFDAGWSSGNGRRVFVDGSSWASVATTASAAQPRADLGLSAASNSIAEIYFDDVIFDDNTFATSGFPGAGQSILVKPNADPASLNSWTGGAGGTSNIFNAVIVSPPGGKSAAGENNTTQIKNAASGGNLDYKPTTPSYQTAGVGASDTINAVMAITNDCEEVSTGTKAGGVWIDSNPAQTAGGNTFDFGDDTSTVCGTFGSLGGWITHYGPVNTTGVTSGSAATVAIRKTTSTTRISDADFLGIYVDYTPAPPPPPGGHHNLPTMGIGAWLLTKLWLLFEPTAMYGYPPPSPHSTVDSDFLGIYVDYTPSEVIPASPHFTPTPTTLRSR